METHPSPPQCCKVSASEVAPGMLLVTKRCSESSAAQWKNRDFPHGVARIGKKRTLTFFGRNLRNYHMLCTSKISMRPSPTDILHLGYAITNGERQFILQTWPLNQFRLGYSPRVLIVSFPPRVLQLVLVEKSSNQRFTIPTVGGEGQSG